MFGIRLPVLILFFFLSSASTQAAAASIEELVAGAKREGAVSFYAPTTVTPAGAKMLAQAFTPNSISTLRSTTFPPAA